MYKPGSFFKDFPVGGGGDGGIESPQFLWSAILFKNNFSSLKSMLCLITLK